MHGGLRGQIWLGNKSWCSVLVFAFKARASSLVRWGCRWHCECEAKQIPNLKVRHLFRMLVNQQESESGFMNCGLCGNVFQIVQRRCRWKLARLTWNFYKKPTKWFCRHPNANSVKNDLEALDECEFSFIFFLFFPYLNSMSTWIHTCRLRLDHVWLWHEVRAVELMQKKKI